MLEEDKRCVSKIVPQEIIDLIYGRRLDWVKHRFYEIGGETGDKEADCVLISAALTFARDNDIYMFSHDKPLRRTFAIRVDNNNDKLKKTFIVKEEDGMVVTTKGYLNGKW